jgi:spore coat assembly protein
MEIKIGDIVGRKSYGCDIVFKVHDIITQKDGKTIIYLKGINYRILADATEADLVKLPANKINEDTNSLNQRIERISDKITKSGTRGAKSPKKILTRDSFDVFKRPGKVLHMDADDNYLQMCLKQYKKLGINAVGKLIPEAEQPNMVRELLISVNPDILVMTGHDGMIKSAASGNPRDYNSISNYRNSKYFIDGVREARKYEPSLDQLVIFAGACQSYYEGILAAGANFASAPSRVLIHALDPVMVGAKIAFAPIDKILPLEEVLNSTITGMKGIGGLQTRGKYRDGMPNTPYVVP